MEQLFSWQSLSESVEIDNGTLLLTRAPTAALQQQIISDVTNAGAKYCITGVSENVITLIFSEKSMLLTLAQDIQYICLPLHPLCEITVFLDESQQAPELGREKAFFLNADINAYDELIYWFICSYLMGNTSDEFAQLLACIRRQESYFLTGYLVKNRCSNEKINTLCQTYGLSYSYFRKISKKYLGVSAKTKMCEWRLAQTILDILEGDSSITDIALKNGYSSSAHVCSTFKAVLGISPYAIRKINGK